MQSSELARLAGVTVRTLRHYHRVGLLPEPDRRANGYRVYDVRDLVRVLRIRRLAGLGIPLDRMPGLLDGASPDAGELLDELDAELAAQIDRLEAQRRVVALLRDHDAAPDLPPEFARFAAVFASGGMSPVLAQADRDQFILLAHFAGADGLSQIARFTERLADPELVPAVTALSRRFERLGPTSTDDEVDDLIEAFVRTVSPVVQEFAASEPEIDLGAAAGLVADYSSESLNDRQRHVIAELERRLGSLVPPPSVPRQGEQVVGPESA